MEIWKPVLGYESFYIVSNKGRCQRLKTIINIKNHRTQKTRVIFNRILKLPVGKRGYPMAYLHGNGKKEKRPIHIFITKSFFGISPIGHEVNHKDGNKLNNNISNLEYVTHKENLDHAFRMGLRVMPKGENHCCSKITNDDVIKIREEFFNNNITKKSLADKYKIHPSHIGRIISKKYWKHI